MRQHRLRRLHAALGNGQNRAALAPQLERLLPAFQYHFVRVRLGRRGRLLRSQRRLLRLLGLRRRAAADGLEQRRTILLDLRRAEAVYVQ